jgi:putative transposase
MKFDRETHRRRSIRLAGYDYSRPGVFFVTLCTFQREEILGAMVDEEMQLSPLGRIVRTEWFRSAEMRKEIQLFKTEFVIMPNHLHGIVWIIHDDGAGAVPRKERSGAGGIRPTNAGWEARCADVNRESAGDTGAGAITPTQSVGAGTIGDRRRAGGARCEPLQRTPRSLGSFIAGFKAAVTGRAGDELNSTNIWQQNYYEHIIRNEDELQEIRVYIHTNPRRWQEDQLHPSAPPNKYNQEEQ